MMHVCQKVAVESVKHVCHPPVNIKRSFPVSELRWVRVLRRWDQSWVDVSSEKRGGVGSGVQGFAETVVEGGVILAKSS